MNQPTDMNVKLEIVEIGENDDDYDVDDFENLPITDSQSKEEEDIDVFICNYCLVYFTTKKLLKTHMQEFHFNICNSVEQYECDICMNPKVYTRPQDIRKHMRSHHNTEIDDLSSLIRKSGVPDISSHLSQSWYPSYECTPCEKTYARKQDIIKHMRYVHKEHNIDPSLYRNRACLMLIDFPECTKNNFHVYKCDVCEEYYTEAVLLVKHMSSSHQKDVGLNEVTALSVEMFACKFCNQTNFKSIEKLKTHCQESHKYLSHIYLCPQCNLHFSYGCNMGNHLRDEHGDTMWTNRDLLNTIVKAGKEKKLKNQKDDFIYKCNFCSENFEEKEQVINHLELIHNTNINEYLVADDKSQAPRNKEYEIMNLVCRQCDQTFSCKKSLADHMNLEDHFQKNSICHLCNELFENMNSLWSHVFAKHATGPFECSLCPQVFDRKKKVLAHIAKHGIIINSEHPKDLLGLKEKSRLYVDGVLKYQCQECLAILMSFSSLKTHMYRHTGEKPIVCDQCSKQFRTTSQLKIHIESVHDNVRKYRCEYCGHAFSCSSNLSQHIRIHTGEKPYVCDECGNRYAQYASLYSHKLTHAQNRCHICTECGRAFHRVSRLRQHMKIHTGDRPPRSHLCDICHKGFRTRSEMRRHQQIHNSIRSFVCETCGSGFTVRKYLLQHYKIHRDLQEEPSHNVSVETITDLGYAA